MKISLFAIGLGAALLHASTPTPGFAAEPVVAYRDGGDLSNASVLLPVGTPRATILEMVGAPDAQLSSNAWVYWNRRTNQPQRSAGFDALVIVFQAERVSAMKIMIEAEVRQLLAVLDAKRKTNPSIPLLAANPPAQK